MKHRKYDKQQGFWQLLQFFILLDDIIQRILYQSATDNDTLKQQSHKMSEHAEQVISHLETFSSIFHSLQRRKTLYFNNSIFGN